ncbi:Golgi complex component (Vps8), putative [Talaromyces stipitatus ATCC 10500]|uniref:Golgi complex component (Vps8), putative n=1 Tax=Talaromyces stipitatus (strain ATCC 10500 / CBS 375.48 / QM 6759 / NRRL 1006) TaxID=441959 RepID=B8MH59_TALSN|nr:Golgi complex component (Vps8), putative [Talaromyces stipitatus ATCC 10500]EED16873.1 Golgi complex component (Vps8), putative [Talaromyces stipitatus ATCC 10500]
MSSTNEGNDEGAREDELDLGQQDDDLPTHVNGQSEDADADKLENEDADEQKSVDDLPSVNVDNQNYDNQDEEGTPHLLPQAPASADELSSIPDDTPSLHGSLQSSPSSSALAFRASARSSPGPAHRPFDLRFQSRLSSSSFSSPRPSSPFVLHTHSRNSSFASQPPLSSTPDLEPDTPQTPWEVVRWTKLRKIAAQSFSEIGRRNFGRPTCICVSTAIVLGTSKGIVLVFDYQQNLKTIIGPGTKAVEAGAITSLAISADHTTVAVGHAEGEIFTWEISRASRPFLHIPPVPMAQHVHGGAPDGHVAGVAVVHIGFLGTRRTALVSADDRGMAFSHLATRGMGAVARTVKTTRILGRYPEPPSEEVKPRKPSSVLAFSPLPLGNVDQSTDGLGLVAMLTPYLFVIVSTTPVAHTQFKAPRPKEVGSHCVMSAALAWFPAIRLKGKEEVSNTKLVYCWSNVLTVLDVHESDVDGELSKDRPPVLEFRPRSRWRANEAIVAVQWLSRSVLAVLTITQQLLILEDRTLRVTDSFDLLHKHIYHTDIFSSHLRTLVEQYDEENTTMHGVVADAFYHSLKAYKGRLFLLGYNELSVGSLSNWADRLLAYMETGDFVSAIRLATSYYQGDAEKLTVGLPEEDDLRHSVVEEKLLEMVSASLKFAFGRNEDAGIERVQKSQLEALADASISACVCMENFDYLWDEVYEWYEGHDSQGIFLDVLEPFLREEKVRSIPPTALKALINHYSATYTSARLEEVICLLDPTTMDIDQVTTLCKQHNLYDAYIYVWNRVLSDYVGPLEELLAFATRVIESAADVNGSNFEPIEYENAMKVFPYLSFILTGRTYPTGEEMSEDQAVNAKRTLYTYLFTGTHLPGSKQKPFGALRTALKFDSSSFMSMLNEAFEDSFLNDSADVGNGESEQGSGLTINRQFLVSVLLDVMSNSEFGPHETIFLDMFIARNLPKYPQYILLSGSTLYQVLERLCRWPTSELAEDCQLSVEYLLSIYHPPDLQSLIPLFKEAGYYRVLKSTYRAEKQYAELIVTYLQDTSEREDVFTCIYECLRSRSALSGKQREEVMQVIKSRAGELALINVSKTARTVQELIPSLHAVFLKSLEQDDYKQYHYLETLLEPQDSDTDVKVAPAELDRSMVELYVQLLCRYNRSHVADYIDTLRVNELRLDEVLPAIEGSGVVDAAVVLLARQGQVRKAMDRLLAYLSTLESGLMGILTNAEEAPDVAGTFEAVGDLLESVDKYSGVGIWLCQGQTKNAQAQPLRNGHAGSNKRASVMTLQEPLTFEENLWLDLIGAVVGMARNVSSLLQKTSTPEKLKSLLLSDNQDKAADGDVELISSFRQLVQKVFTALLTSTAAGGPSPGERTGVSFLRILRAFLTQAATTSPSLSELRSVLASIFSAYTYEESLLSLANGMLDKDLFVHVNEVTKLRQHGWRPKGQVCEICRRRIWGPGAGASQWTAWERRLDAEDRRRRSARQVDNGGVLLKGKGKNRDEDDGNLTITGSSSGGDADDASLNDTTENTAGFVGSGPVVVFACRHLYHRPCLVSKMRDDGESQSHQKQILDSHGHETTRELVCTTCT